MIVIFHKKFLQQTKRIPKKLYAQLRERLRLFKQEPFDPSLENHPLKGTRFGQRSINITGDYRAVFENKEDKVVLFVEIGRHRDLYE